MTFDDFDNFASMMRNAALEQEQYSSAQDMGYDLEQKKHTLQSMGFEEVLVEIVLADSDSSTPIGDYVEPYHI